MSKSDTPNTTTKSNSQKITAEDMMSELGEIKDTVGKIAERANTLTEPRIVPEIGSHKYKVLKQLELRGAQTNPEMELDGTSNASTRLYQSYLVDREKSENGAYKYSLNDLGRRALEIAEGNEKPSQSSLDKNLENQSSGVKYRWGGSELSKCNYLTLELVKKYDGCPQTTDLEEEYTELGYQSSNGYAVGARLSELFKDGYVERTPHRPYYYWVSDKGKKELVESDD